MIVDDHPLVRDGLQHLLTAAGFRVAGQAADPVGVFSHSDFDSFRLFIIDLSLGDSSGLALISRLQEAGRLTLVYSMHETASVVRQSFQAGAAGYVTKRETPAILVEAINCVLAGKIYRSPQVVEILSDSDPIDELSAQQKQIYSLLGRGLSNSSIASELGISVRTLESYCVRIMNKLNVTGIKQLRQKAILACKNDMFDKDGTS